MVGLAQPQMARGTARGTTETPDGAAMRFQQSHFPSLHFLFDFIYAKRSIQTIF